VVKKIYHKEDEEDEGMGEIVAIWIKRAHRGPMDRVDEAQLVAGRGLEGSADQGGWRQVTIISEESWRDAVAALGEDVDPSRRRANVMVRGVDLENSRGKTLRLGDCVVSIRGENPPCKLMRDMQQPLKPHWRAGVFGEIVAGGPIRVGDSVSYQ
jgi:MOSC domain-containing protein YiiM